MKTVLLLTALSAAAGLGMASGAWADDRPTGEREVTASAAAKKTVPTRRRSVPRQIACTIDGCHPIPPGCHPQTGYNWDGIPTGFDIVVCRPRG